MALTLPEAAKLQGMDVFRATLIEMFAQSSDILLRLPFDSIGGNSMSYNREQTLPGVGFRGVNEGWTESTGVLNPVTERLTITGGDIDVDKFIVATGSENARAIQEMMKIKAIAHNWTRVFLKGDASTEPREFDGLQVRVAGNQLIPAGATSGGDAMSLFLLDAVMDEVDEGLGTKYLVMNKTMRRRLTQAARTTTVGGFISYALDAFGRQVTQYNDVPILIADEDSTGAQILPFTEANPGGGTAASTSIYCVSLGDGALSGIQNGTIDPMDLGEIDASPVLRTRVEWYTGIAVFHGRAAARLHGITNAAIVA